MYAEIKLYVMSFFDGRIVNVPPASPALHLKTLLSRLLL